MDADKPPSGWPIDQLGELADPSAFHAPIDVSGSDLDLLERQLRVMLLIRQAEEAIGEGVARSQVVGPAHLGIGQEAVGVGVSEHLRPSDRVFGAHRSHPHYLALGGDPFRLFCEILGRESGCSRGMGGSMHLFDGERGLMGTVPIVAGTIPLAAGAALAAKKDGRGDIAVAYFGDGATEEGAFHESLNLAAVWKLPILFVCENNLYSSHMHIGLRQPANRVARFAEANCVPSSTIDGNDVVHVSAAVRPMVERARAGEGPSFLEAVTYRWRGHVGHREDEDVGVERGAALAVWKGRDPIRRLTDALVSAGRLDERALAAMVHAVQLEVEDAWRRAESAEFPAVPGLLDGVYARAE